MLNNWELYECDGYEEVLASLDESLAAGIKYAKDKVTKGYDQVQAARELFDSMDIVLDSFDGFGASDTEPRAYLARMINAEFENALVTT